MIKYNDFLSENLKNKINHLIDFTFLSEEATIDNIKHICDLAMKNDYYSVCVRPDFISTAKAFLEDSDVKVCSVISFPKGSDKTREKVRETDKAITDGVDEIDMVMDYKKLIDLTNLDKNNKYDDKYEKQYKYISDDISSIVKKCHSNGIIIKVIIETDALNYEQITLACDICSDAGVDFIKTSTGMLKKFDTLEEKLNKVKYIRKIIPNYISIKVSGGIRTIDDINKFIQYVDRIGTSAIISPKNNKKIK